MGFLQQLPTAEQLSSILTPVMGNEATGTGVVGVLKLLEKVDTANLFAAVTADLDRSIGASVSVDTSALTGGTLGQFQQALGALPHDPAQLTAPFKTKLEEIRNISSTGLSAQLLEGMDGLRNLQSLLPADTRELIAGAADRLSQLKREFISGEFGQFLQWSDSVQNLYAELAPLLTAGTGTLEERLLAYLREKVCAMVELLLPAGDWGKVLSGKLDVAVSADLVSKVGGIKASLVGLLNQVRMEFDNGNFTNTVHLSTATAAFQQLLDLLTCVTATLRPILEADLSMSGLLGRLQKQFDTFDQIEIVDLGNIKDKFAAAIKRVEEIISGLDLESVRTRIEEVFSKIDATIGKLDLKQFASKLTDLQEKLQSILEAIDGALFEALASIRTVFGQIRDGLKSAASALGTYSDDGGFRFHVQEDLEKFLNGIKTALQNTLASRLEQLKNTVGQTLQQVQTGLTAVQGEIEKVQDQLESTLQGINTQLQSLDLPKSMESISQKLNDMLEGLGKVDFDAVVNPVVADIDEMAGGLKKIDPASLNEITAGALKVSVAVVRAVDFPTQITDALMAEIEQLLEIPKKALADIEGKVEVTIKQFGELAPDVLLAPLDKVFQPITSHLEALQLATLLKPLDDWYARLQVELDKVSPVALLQPLIELHRQLGEAFQGISPSALIHPLQEAIDGIKLEMGKVDVTGIASEFGGSFDQLKKSFDGLSPARLLNPMVGAFDKVMGALDKFDPGILLKPFADVFDALAAPLANLTEDQARMVSDVFVLVRGAIDAFDPQHLFQVLQEKLSTVQAICQQLNPGGLIAALKTPYDAMQASFQTHGGSANVSLAATVADLNPLRNPSLCKVVEDFQDLQTKLNAAAQAQPPADLVSRYTSIKPKLESLLPVWAKENITPASIRRVFQAANPLGLKTEIDQLYAAVKEKLRVFDPHVIQEHLQGSFDKCKDAILAFDPNFLQAEVQKTIQALTQRLDAVNLQLIADELQGLADEINSVIAGLDPQPIIGQLQGLVDEVKGAAESLRPSQVLAELKTPLEASKALVEEFNPSVFKEPLQEVFKDIQAILATIDLSSILQPLADRLKHLRDSLEQSLKQTQTAFNGMIQAIPV